jgi:hypothetical protein
LSSRLAITFTIVVIAPIFLPTARAQQKSLAADAQVVETIRTLFNALAADDNSKFESVVEPEFYIFDGGTRFSGHAIVILMEAQHEAGKYYEWHITEPDVHITGKTAWIAYVNKGSITDASGATSQEWLESAFLRKHAGAWKIVFMHSTRVPTAPQSASRE